jgi:hypothetical protein
MKHPTLFRILLTLACAIACLYAQMAVDAARSDNALFALGALLGACLTLPLIKKIRNRYTRRAWPDTLLMLIAGAAACAATLNWKAALSFGDVLTILGRCLHWTGVALYTWSAVGILLAGLWLLVAMPRWWRKPGHSGHMYFGDLVHDRLRSVYPVYVHRGGILLLGALGGALLGSVLSWIITLAGFSFGLLPFWIHVSMRLLLGGLFGWIAARWHLDNLWRKTPPGLDLFWREQLGPWLVSLRPRRRRRA